MILFVSFIPTSVLVYKNYSKMNRINSVLTEKCTSLLLQCLLVLDNLFVLW